MNHNQRLLFAYYDEDLVFHFRCFIGNESIATLCINTQTKVYEILHDVKDDEPFEPWAPLIQPWLIHQLPILPDMMTAFNYIEEHYEQLHVRLIAQIINDSLCRPELFTIDYWNSLPDLLTISTNYWDIQPTMHVQQPEVSLILE